MVKAICSIENCPRGVVGRGLCDRHYRQWKLGMLVLPEAATLTRAERHRMMPPACTVAGCPNGAIALGLCAKHRARKRAHGDPLLTERPTYGSRRRVTQNGYVMIWEPDHPLATALGYVYEHRKVLHDLGVPLTREDEVHHVNGDKTDNRPENLEVLGRGEHQRRHLRERGVVRNQYGTFAVRRLKS